MARLNSMSKNQVVVGVKDSKAVANPATPKDFFLSKEEDFRAVLPEGVDVLSYINTVAQVVMKDEDLKQVGKKTLLAAILQAAELGLQPNTSLGLAYIIPYGKTLQFQVGYRGMIELAHRGGLQVEAHTVYENDEFSLGYTMGGPVLSHTPTLKGSTGDVIGYYMVYRGQDCSGVYYMTLEQVKEYKGRYVNGRSKAWDNCFDAMAKKTVIKQGLKYAPLNSTQLEKAYAADSRVVEEIDDYTPATPVQVVPSPEPPLIEVVEEEEQPKKKGRSKKESPEVTPLTIDPETGEILDDVTLA